MPFLRFGIVTENFLARKALTENSLHRENFGTRIAGDLPDLDGQFKIC